MKAYVIKNKEGKYFVTDDIFGENILNAYIWVKEQYAKLHIGLNHIKDCEVVEITIAEGDLEKQLAEKDEEIERLRNFKWDINNALYMDAYDEKCGVDSIVLYEALKKDIRRILNEFDQIEGENK